MEQGSTKDTSAGVLESTENGETVSHSESNLSDSNSDIPMSNKLIPLAYHSNSINMQPTVNDSIMQYPTGGTSIHDISEDNDEVNRSYHSDKSSKDNLLDYGSALQDTTSNTQTLMHLIKGNLGTGILALPLAFKSSGIWTGLFGNLFVGFVALHCMHMLVRCGHILCKRTGKQTMDYADVAEYCLKTGPPRLAKFSNAGRIFVNTLLIITQMGFCCVYIVFIATSFHQVIEHYNVSNPNLRLYELIVMVVLIPFVFIKKLETLAPFSAFANVLTFTGLIIIFQYIVQDLPNVSQRPGFSSVYELPMFFGTAFFSIEGISLVLPLENSMKEPEVFSAWNGVLNLGMVMVTVLYTGMGFYGYLKFGDGVKGSITLNLPTDNWLYVSVKLMFAAAIFITYGVQLYVPIKIIWPTLKKRTTNPFLLAHGEYILRICFVFITFGFAAAIPHLDLLISLIGAFASSSLAIILPVIIEILTYSVDGHHLSKWIIVKNVLIFMFGILGCLTGTYSSAKQIVDTFKL